MTLWIEVDLAKVYSFINSTTHENTVSLGPHMMTGSHAKYNLEEGTLQADGSKKIEPTMKVEDVGRAVAYMASLPTDTNIPFLTIMANQMPYMGRG